MRPYQLLLMAGCCAFAFAAHGQVLTNLPPTEIENFEIQTDAMIVKGYSDVGSIDTGGGTISVRCKQSTDAATSKAEYGITVGLVTTDTRGFLVVDYDELDALLNGMAFLSRINYDVTPMSAFDAALTTRSGLRISAHSVRRDGGIQTFVQFAGSPRIALSSVQFSQLHDLVQQAKASLDLIRSKSSTP